MKKEYKNIKKKTPLELIIFNITSRLTTDVGALNPSPMSITKSQCTPTQEKEEDKSTLSKSVSSPLRAFHNARKYFDFHD